MFYQLRVPLVVISNKTIPAAADGTCDARVIPWRWTISRRNASPSRTTGSGVCVLNGLEVLEALRRDRPETPVIVLTGQWAVEPLLDVSHMPSGRA